MAKFTSAEQENVVVAAVAVQPNGQVVEIALKNLQVGLGGKSMRVATQTASFMARMSENTSASQVQLRIRGFIQLDPVGVRALLLAHLGDTSAFVPLVPDEFQNYEQVVQTTVPAGVDVQVTLFLLTERDDTSREGLFTVDELELTLG